MPMEKQNKLVDLSVDFAVQILNLVKSASSTVCDKRLLTVTDFYGQFTDSCLSGRP